MRYSVSGNSGLGAVFLGFLGDLVRFLLAGLGFFVLVLLASAVIGAGAGGYFAYTAELAIGQGAIYGAFGGAFLALIAMAFFAFMNSW